MKLRLSGINERLFASKEISSIGTVGTMRILRGKATKLLNFLGRILSYTSIRSYGCFLLSFGLASLILNLSVYYFKSEPDVTFASLVTSAVMVLLAVPLLLFDKPISAAVQDFAPADKFFFEFLSLKRIQKDPNHVSIHPMLALFVGVIPALVAFFIPIELVIVGLAVICVVLLAFTSPEFSLIFTILFLPYIPLLPHSVLILCAMSVITFLSFALKVVIGKRVFHLCIFDVILVSAMLLMFVSGILGNGENSFKLSLVFIALMLGYFPASNMIVNKRLADSATNAMVVSAIPVTVAALIEFALEMKNISINPFSLSTEISAFFPSPEVLAAFILVSAILTLTFTVEKKQGIEKGFYLCVFLAEMVVLGLVMRPESWIAAVVALLAYLVVKSRRIPADSLLILILLPCLLFLVPSGFIDTVYGYLGITSSFEDMKIGLIDSLHVFLENPWFGIGRGKSAYFNTVGTDAVTPVLNVPIGIAMELGVFVFALIALCIVLRFRQFSYYRLYLRSSSVYAIGEMTMVAIMALLAFGMLSYVLSDASVFYLFCIVFAMSTATLRTSRKEFDDRFGYYGDSSSAELSAIDVGLSKNF